MESHVLSSPSVPAHRALLALLLCTLLAAAGCADKSIDRGTLYQQLGSEAGVATFANDVARQIEQDPRIKDTFAQTDLPRFEQALAGQMCESGGGPCAGQGAAMQAALSDLKLSSEQFDAFVGDVAKTLDRHDIGPSAQRTLLFPIKAMRGEVLTMGK